MGVAWADVAQDKDRWCALLKKSNEPLFVIKCGEFLD
jgi:hypothetical protein